MWAYFTHVQVYQKLASLLIYAKQSTENGQLIFEKKESGNDIVTLATKIL